jgi:hypothetical protein
MRTEGSHEFKAMALALLKGNISSCWPIIAHEMRKRRRVKRGEIALIDWPKFPLAHLLLDPCGKST